MRGNPYVDVWSIAPSVFLSVRVDYDTIRSFVLILQCNVLIKIYFFRFYGRSLFEFKLSEYIR